jgi:DNA mismatch endonuclease (patch repair protein)
MLSAMSFAGKGLASMRMHLGMDKLTAERRSWNMSRVRSRNTKPERTVRSLLHRMGYRFRLHRRDLPGSPDIVLPKHRTAIFVHGCFWHRHEGCARTSTPRTRKEFWLKKFQENVTRDLHKQTALAADGWRVLIVWQCELDNLQLLSDRLSSELQAKPAD